MDELKKIRDDLDKDKDPNASKQGEESRSKRAPEAATSAHVEGESSGAAAGGDKGPVDVDADAGAISDSELDPAAELVLGAGEVVEEMVEDWRTDDDLAGKFNFIETAKGKRIEYESLPVNSDVISGFVFGCEMPEEIFNPIRIPEEVSVAAHKWFRNLPDDTQRKRYLSTKGEYSGQIRSWDFDEQHGLVMIKRTDEVQYFRPRAKYLQTLPARDLHHLQQDFLGDMRLWCYDSDTHEAVIVFNDDRNFRILDPMWLVNMSASDITKLYRHDIIYEDKDAHQALKFQRIACYCYYRGIHSGSSWSERHL
ncbi:hypothetical protein HanIR_Chr05g0250121 [Helianthus annuus]|nr:hypothetical protein HanIR_Chr05g0250121 [Helianthus annuus]